MPPKEDKLTVSVATADVGGFVGHVSSHPDILDTAKERLHNAREKRLLCDFYVLRCGDGIGLILIHRSGVGDKAVHETARATFDACAEVAVELKLHRAGEGVAAAPGGSSGGPAIAEIEFFERQSEPVVVFMANKGSAGIWNLPLYRIFADPFNTVGLVMDPLMFEGFSFTVADAKSGAEITLSTPKDTYSLLALIGLTSRYVVTSVARNSGPEAAAVTAARGLGGGGGACPVARDNPAMVLRCQAGLPAVGEALESFSMPHLVAGWMRDAYNGPLMPVPFYEANPSRFDGPPRLISAGFQISGGRLIGPHDMFDDPSFDETRRLANKITDYMRRHGPFQPHRLSEEETGHTTMSGIIGEIKKRFRQ